MTGQGQCKVLVAQSEKNSLCQKKEPLILQGEVEDVPLMPPHYIPTAPPPGAADLHLPDSLLPFISPPPPDVPEAFVPPWPATPEPMSRYLW